MALGEGLRRIAEPGAELQAFLLGISPVVHCPSPTYARLTIWFKRRGVRHVLGRTIPHWILFVQQARKCDPLRSRRRMSKLLSVLVVLSSFGLAQSSSDGAFSVHHLNNVNYSVRPAQMREAESIYHTACSVVQREFHSGASELCPHFTVVIGAEQNELHSRRAQGGEIWMKKWDPIVFAQGVVVLTFDHMLTRDVIVQLGNRALRQSNATADVAGLK
jgi:hypothetical protein